MIRLLLVPSQASVVVERPGPPSAAELIAWLHIPKGYLECVSLMCGDPPERTQLWIDEEGKFRQPVIVNKFATTLYQGWQAFLKCPQPWDYIVGNAVLLTGKNLMP